VSKTGNLEFDDFIVNLLCNINVEWVTWRLVDYLVQVNKEGRPHMVSAESFANGSAESMAFILQYKRFVTNLLKSTRNDNIVLMLLIVMTLLSPDRATTSSIGAISSAQEEYASVLANYVGVHYPGEHLMLPRLLQQLATIRDMNERHAEMLMNMQVDKLEPLITEIFDLNVWLVWDVKDWHSTDTQRYRHKRLS